MQSNNQTPNSAINSLLRYHVSEDHLPKGCDIFKKEALLLVLGLGGLNYVPVAYQNGHTVTMSIINAVTTAILGEIVLYTSGEFYYKIKIQPQYIDLALENIIQAPLTKEEFIREVAGQGILALASAVPLATTLFDAHLEIFEEHPWLFWLAFSFILAVNTAMHLVPIELTLRDEFYGFLPHQLMRLWNLLSDYQPSVEEQARSAKLELRTAALNEINPVFTNAKENFLHILAYENNSEIQARVNRYHASPELLLKDMLACYKKTLPLNPYAKTTARVLGGLVVSLACLGYAANPYLVFKNDFGFSVAGAIASTVIPIYFFMVLMTFFGDGMGVRVLQDLLSLSQVFCQPATVQKRLPTVAKLYPGTFVILAASILFIVAFAGAPGREMMKTAFSEIFYPWLMVIMLGVVDIGIGLLAFYAPLDFTKIMLNHYAQHYGAEPVRNIAILKAKIEALQRDFNRINPEHAETLKTYIKSFVPSTNQEELEEVVGAQSYSNCCACFYYAEASDSEDGTAKKPLLERV